MTIRTLWQRDGGLCWLCGASVDLTLPNESLLSASRDHVIPTCIGGSNTSENIRLAHRLCNERRTHPTLLLNLIVENQLFHHLLPEERAAA